MIKFYRPVDCAACAEIEAALQEMVIAHQVIVVEPDEQLNFPVPALKDNGQIFSGQQAIAAHLRELEKTVADWRRFQSDACYIDDDGEVC